MKKEQVGMLQFSAQIDGEDAVMIRTYRDGTLIRDGGGGLPPMFVEGKYRSSDNKLFHQLLDLIPAQLLEKPMVWQAPPPLGTVVDYKVLLYGINRNGGVGTEADWGDMGGLRVVFDLRNPPPNALVSLADKFINAAKLVTNRAYFDMLIKAATGYHSSTLPENVTLLAQENNPVWLEHALTKFVGQLQQLHPNVKVEDFGKGKFYKDPFGRNHLLLISFTDSKFGYRFVLA
jgi:hypothetical protein